MVARTAIRGKEAACGIMTPDATGRGEMDVRSTTMEGPEVRYEWLRPEEIRARREEKPLAYVPLGTLEWHGLQNPVGLDGLKAHALCVMAAQSGGGLVFPPVWYGEHRESALMESEASDREEIHTLMGLPSSNFVPGYMQGGTTVEQANFYNTLLWHVANEVASLGFEAAVFLAGHYPLATYAGYMKMMVERNAGLSMWAGHEGHVVEEGGYGRHGDHAGPWETSLMMAVSPESVDLERLDQEPEVRPVGCSFDPREATEEFGREWSGKVAECLVRIGDELLERAPH
jgi:creatinine amidohydrolase